MCGIAGYITTKVNCVDRDVLEKMTRAVAHRGPDDEGIIIEGRVGFGHRRLSIIDLSSAGHQPMTYIGKYIITYNGEIYNYLEIRDDLIHLGYQFNSKTDTEVILAAYDKWGFDCVKKFNGMWAFAIYDKEKNIIFCSRDRFGIKPFYYSDSEYVFLFGSEIKQILLFKERRIANLSAVKDFLLFGFSEHTNETFFQDIYTLRPGYNLVYDLTERSFSENRYYSIVTDPSLSSMNEVESARQFLSEFNRSIDYRLRSDVKVGTCLSGGLDSSSVATLASKKYFEKAQTKFQAIHAKSSELETDESNYAEEIAESSNIDLHTIEPSTDEFIEAIDDVVYCQEEPFGSVSIFMQYFVFKKAKEMGCKVMLDGQGGDETLLGYERYYPAYLRSLPLREAIKGFLDVSRNSRLTLKELFRYLLYFSISFVRIARIKQKFSFIKREYLTDFSHIKQSAASYLDMVKLQKLEIESLQLPHLLRYEDKNSMRHSIEARLPMLDYKLVETAFGINNSLKIKDGWTKYILRKAMTGQMPEGIIWRKNKLGFNAPETTWIREIRSEMESTILNSKLLRNMSKCKIPVEIMDTKTLWRFFCVAKWEKVYNVSLH